MVTMTRRAYAEMFGPTTGDCVRLGDTPLLAEVEHDHAVPGDECMIGGGIGSAFAVDSGSLHDIRRMLRSSEGFPMNFGLFSRGNSHNPSAIEELIAGGIIGVKIHEDFGGMPATIDACLSVADALDFQVQLHTDTLNESGFYERTMDAIAGRTIHMYHTEGAGGGHAPDIIRCNGEPHCLPSSTNPTNPYTSNTFDEHLDMTMSSHILRPDIPEDVAHAEGRIRRQSISAEDVLHDIGAISMMDSDSQGMGRVNEVVTRTWQLAAKMKDQRGRFPEETTGRGDNERIKRYIAKYTINAARTFGIAKHVGSIEPGKMADLVVWAPSHFGIKAAAVYKKGFIAWAGMGDGAACLSSCEPILHRPQWGAFGSAAAAIGANFVHPLALEAKVAERLGLTKPLLALSGTRTLRKSDMLHNDACPDITVDPQTFDVFVDGVLAACEPAERLYLTQKYLLR